MIKYEIPNFIYEVLAEPLSVIFSFFNESVKSGIFPDDLKKARVTPIFKKGDRSNIENFRPISNLPFLAKVLEKLMLTRLNSFITQKCILSPRQFGFKSGSCTSDAILEFLDQIYKSLDKRALFLSIFLDLRRAFDTVDHRVLLGKLDAYGIRGVANNWFGSYLFNRQQYVKVGNSCSELKTICLGVPQGAVLAPLLFNLYINDMSNCCQDLCLIHYADDTTAFLAGSCIENIFAVANRYLENIQVWLQSNRLSLNVPKTNFMLFGYVPPTVRVPNLIIPGENIHISEKSNFLGIVIDHKLTFEAHVNELLTKLSRVSGVLWRSRNLAPKTVRKSIYFSLA